MMTRKLALLLITLCSYCLSFSQITITEFDKKVEKEVLKPRAYDSLKNFEFFDYNSDSLTEDLYYKQYIGQKVFHSPCISEQLGNFYNYKPTFYSYKPTFIKLDRPVSW